MNLRNLFKIHIIWFRYAIQADNFVVLESFKRGEV